MKSISLQESKLKGLWVLIAVFLTITSIVILVPGGASGTTFSARLVAGTNDGNGQAHIVYELTNATRNSQSIRLEYAGLECYSDWSGWWPATRALQPRPIGVTNDIAVHCPATLNARATAKVELILAPSFRNASAIRGRIWHVKDESKTVRQVRTLLRKAGIPSSWLMWPKPAFLELPPAKLSFGSSNFTARSTDAGVENRSEDVFPAGAIKFQQAELRIVLEIYAEMAAATLDIDKPIRSMQSRVTVENSEPLTCSAALALLEKALQQQAGIRMARLDRQNIKVTCDPPPESHK